MTDKKAIILALAVVIINGLIGHFFAPSGIMLTPVVLIITSSLVAFGTKKISPIWKSILTFAFVALNDIIIKLYSGGRHDSEGLGWIQMTMFLGLLPSFVILLTTVFKDKQEKTNYKVIAVCLFPTLFAIYLYLFNDLGLGRYYWYDWNN